MDEIGLHCGDDFAGAGIGGDERIQSFGFTAEGDDQAATGMAEFAGEREEFFLRCVLWRLGCVRKRWKQEKGEKQGQERAMVEVLCAAVVHIRLPKVFLSILYAWGRSCNELARAR